MRVIQKKYVVFIIVLIKLLTQINFNEAKLPVIGILANNYPNLEKYPLESEVLDTYVSWVISSGAKVIVINPWDTKDYIDFILSKVDGILFQGGEVPLTLDHEFTLTAQYILNKIIYLRNTSIKNIAVWGTCMGFQLLNNLIENKDILTHYKAKNVLIHTSKFNIEELKQSKQYKFFNEGDLKILMEKKVLNENHGDGVNRETYLNSKNLRNFFRVNTYAVDDEGVEYVESIEAFEYNIFGVQSHPEKTVYGRDRSGAAASSLDSMRINRNFVDMFLYYAANSKLLVDKDGKEITLNFKDFDVYSFLSEKENNKKNYNETYKNYQKYELRTLDPRINLPIESKSGTLRWFYQREDDEK